MRKLFQEEIDLLERLLEQDVLGAEQLRSQILKCLVVPINNDETLLRLEVSPDAAPAILPYRRNVAVEAAATDVDGYRIEVLLHVKDGFIFELEYHKVNGSPQQRRPGAKDLCDFISYWQ